MKVNFLNQLGGGYTEQTEVEEGTTAGELFARKLPNAASSDYTILVNRQNVQRTVVLAEGDTVSVTPAKIKGQK